MLNQQTFIDITPDELIKEVSKMRDRHLRLVQISCTKKDYTELIYTFDNDYNLENLRVNIKDDTQIESVSHIYSFAFLYENEIKDLFGVEIKNMNIDFKGNLYKTSVKHPFNNKEEK